MTENVTFDISDSAQRVVPAAPPPLCETIYPPRSGKWREKMTDLWQPNGWCKKSPKQNPPPSTWKWRVAGTRRGRKSTVLFFSLSVQPKARVLLLSRFSEPQMDLSVPTRVSFYFFFSSGCFWCPTRLCNSMLKARENTVAARNWRGS